MTLTQHLEAAGSSLSCPDNVPEQQRQQQGQLTELHKDQQGCDPPEVINGGSAKSASVSSLKGVIAVLVVVIEL